RVDQTVPRCSPDPTLFCRHTHQTETPVRCVLSYRVRSPVFCTGNVSRWVACARSPQTHTLGVRTLHGSARALARMVSSLGDTRRTVQQTLRGRVADRSIAASLLSRVYSRDARRLRRPLARLS